MNENVTFKAIQISRNSNDYFVVAIYPVDESGGQSVLVYQSHNRSKEKIYDIAYSEKPIESDDELINIVINKSDCYYYDMEEVKVKPGGVLNQEKYILPKVFWQPQKDCFEIKVVNNTGCISDEVIEKFILNNPKFNACLRLDHLIGPVRERQYVTTPKYEGKDITELQKTDSEVTPSLSIGIKEHNQYVTDYFAYCPKRSESTNNTITIFDKHPDYEDGIIAYVIKHRITIDTKAWTIVHTVSCTNRIEHVPGEVTRVVKFSRKQEVETTAFEALNLNTKNICYSGNTIWKSGENTEWNAFLWNNLKYFEKSGFLTLLKNANTSHGGILYNEDASRMVSTYITYLTLILTYPVFELLVKSGYTKLFFDAFEELKMKGNKQEMDNYIKKFDELVDNNATKGKMVLRFPNYIGEYLRTKSAPLSEYFAWRDLYELEDISNGLFAKIIGSPQFAIFNFESNINMIANVLKYGYTTEKLINFVVKEFLKGKKASFNTYHGRYKESVSGYLTTLKDYLHMCDMMGITPDLYPQDLAKVHDDLVKLYRSKENELTNKTFAEIAKQATEYVVPTQEQIDDPDTRVSNLWKDYIVKFPDSQEELIEEGNMQHNCVGSYNRRILNGDCIIFFIRKKSDPEMSFITAECTTNGLGQCMFQNNRPVTEENLYKFASSIANKLITGVRSGKISALSKI